MINAWARRSGLAIAWLTLEASENDPARLLQHIAGAIERAGGPNPVPTNRWASIPGADLAGTVVPMMLNELAGRSQPIVLILDDCHVLTDPRCHDVLSALVRWTPDSLRIVIATRADSPLPLGRWRAAGQLSELRVADLRFGADEAERFLNDVLGLGLDGSSVAVLQERTEGWPAGLYLAALSLMSRADRAGFIREFAGSSRHVVDYLAPEVLDPLDPDDRRFLLETSILERLTGSLCDAVTGRSDSAARLSELYRSNLFLTALDDDGTWFRHHRLFGQLLNALLANESPDLIPELHGRAADWHAEHGPLELLVRHALLAGRRDQASLAVARDWRKLTSAGHYDTLQALLDALGPDRGRFTAPLAAIEAINAGLRGSAHELIERWLAIAEHAPWDGPTPDGLEDISISIAVARASFIGKDLSTSIESSRRLIGRQPEAPYVDGMGRASLGMGLVLMGDPAGALEALEGFGDYPEAPLVDLYGLAARALALTMSGDASAGETVAALAHLRAHASGLARSLVGGVVALASGVAIAHQGRVQEAQPFLEEALRYWGVPVDALPRAYVLLSMAPVVADNGDLERARQLAREARVDPVRVSRWWCPAGAPRPGRTWPQRPHEGDSARRRHADRGRGPRAPTAGGSAAAERYRCRALPLDEHGEDPREGDQSQARHDVAARSRGTGARTGPHLSLGSPHPGWNRHRVMRRAPVRSNLKS